MKHCVNSQCKQVNPQSLSAYEKFRKKNGKSYFFRLCKYCRRPSLLRNAAKWRETHREQHRRSHRASRLKREYGVTIEQFSQMFIAQGGKCKICGKLAKLGVDHSHKTGQVRALLCNGCNSGLGLFREDPTILCSAIAYLELYNTSPTCSKISKRDLNETFLVSRFR